MRSTDIRLAVALLAVAAMASPLLGQDGEDHPTVWMGPPSYDNARCFRELFENPDAWKETRSVIDVLQCADHQLDRQFTDDELRAWFSQLQEWQLKFALEVGAVKPWGQTGERTFAVQQPKWERFRRLGAKLYAIAMDEPLLCCRKHINKPDAYALEETADFIARVRTQYPDMLIGDIETFPSIPLEDHYWWINALEKRLAEKGVRGLNFYRLDVNWANFVVQDTGCWGDVRKLEEYCRKRKLPFTPSDPYSCLIGVSLGSDKQKSDAVSPMHYVSKDNPPILILHRTHDALVPYAQSTEFVAALKEKGVEALLQTLPGSGHGGSAFGKPAVAALIQDFFDKHLQGKNVTIELVPEAELAVQPVQPAAK